MGVDQRCPHLKRSRAHYPTAESARHAIRLLEDLLPGAVCRMRVRERGAPVPARIETPCRITASHHKERIDAVIGPDGTVTSEGFVYLTLSGAAAAIKTDCSGSKRTENGWDWWRREQPDGSPGRPLSEIRRRLIDARAAASPRFAADH